MRGMRLFARPVLLAMLAFVFTLLPKSARADGCQDIGNGCTMCCSGCYAPGTCNGPCSLVCVDCPGYHECH
jgi:hypothetical protein